MYLRPGHVYTKTGVVEFTEPVLRRHKEIYPDVNIITRGDSGFADPNLYCLLEDNDCEYVIRLKSNAVLVREGGNTEVKLFEEMNKEDDFYSYRCIYGEFYYKAASWRQSRRVIVRAEKKLGSLVVVLTFYVTNLTWSPKEIVKFYNKRGTMELFIKEAKNDFSFDNMNRKTFLSNKIALQISMIAYNINNLLRRLCFPEEKKKMRMKTIRAGIIKIGARQVQSGRYTTFKMSSHAVNQKLFSQIFENIAKMKKGLRPQVA